MTTLLESTTRSDRHGWRVATRFLVPLASTFGGLGSATAQQNATTVGNVVGPALSAYCNAGANSVLPAVCALQRAPAATLAQLAPDKFVLQTVAVQGSVDQQFNSARIRLCELRDAQLGDGICKRDGVRASLGLAPRPSGTTRVAADAAPGSWAFRPAVFSASPVRQAEAVVAPASGSFMLTQAAATDAGPAQDAGTGAIAPNPLGVYFRVNGRNDKDDPTDFDPGFKTRSANLTVGADYLLGPNGVIGASLDYDSSRSTLATGDGTPSGHVTTHGGGLSIYGAYFPAPTAYIDATLIYGHNRYSSTRNIPALTDSAVGKTGSNQFGLDLGAGYSLQSARFNYGPYARVTFSHTKVAAFTEDTNASNSNLAVAKQSVNSLTSAVGAQASFSVSQGWGVLVPNARVEWEHQYKDDRARSIVASFAGGTPNPANVIPLSTTPVDRNYFNLGLGLAAHFGVGRSALIYYQTVLGRAGQTSHAVTAELRLEI